MDTSLQAVIAFTIAAVVLAVYQFVMAWRDHREVQEIREQYDVDYATFVDRGTITDTPPDIEGVDPGYTVEHRHEHPDEFDDGTGYLKVGSEIRVKPGGIREPVVTIGDVDFALTDAPQLALAVLQMYGALIDAEGLAIGVIDD